MRVRKKSKVTEIFYSLISHILPWVLQIGCSESLTLVIEIFPSMKLEVEFFIIMI